MPPSVAAPAPSLRNTCESASATPSWPDRARDRTPSRLPLGPLATERAASLPSSSPANRWRRAARGLDFGADLVAAFLVDSPLELVARDLAVVVLAGAALADRPAAGPRSPPTSRLTMRVRSSIRLVSLSTSAWLAVLFSRFCT